MNQSWIYPEPSLNQTRTIHGPIVDRSCIDHPSPNLLITRRVALSVIYVFSRSLSLSLPYIFSLPLPRCISLFVSVPLSIFSLSFSLPHRSILSLSSNTALSHHVFSLSLSLIVGLSPSHRWFSLSLSRRLFSLSYIILVPSRSLLMALILSFYLSS